jgi:hypothetical protein
MLETRGAASTIVTGLGGSTLEPSTTGYIAIVPGRARPRSAELVI